MQDHSTLLLNVGTGGQNPNIDEYVNVLYKSVKKANSSKIVLITSQNEKCKDIANNLKKLIGDEYEVEIKCLPQEKMEFDADKCYEWFYDLVQEHSANRIIVDFSHGTKAMSTAVYAVGLNNNISVFHYAIKSQDKNKNFVAGEEIIKVFDAAFARWQELLKQCRTLLASYQYSAIKDIVRNEKNPQILEGIRENCISLSKFCSAWDRFDYNSAIDALEELDTLIPQLNYKYNTQVEKMLETLSSDSSSLERSIYLMFDLYANGLRRLKNAQYEDAGVRAYRMAELLGQIHLMKLGYKPDKLPINDNNVINFAQEKSIKPHSGFYSFNRTQTKDFLEYIGYDHEVVKFLETIGNEVRDLRNKSILIHGYTAKVASSEILERLFNKLLERIKYFINENQFNNILQTAMFLNNNFKVSNNE